MRSPESPCGMLYASAGGAAFSDNPTAPATPASSAARRLAAAAAGGAAVQRTDTAIPRADARCSVVVGAEEVQADDDMSVE